MIHPPFNIMKCEDILYVVLGKHTRSSGYIVKLIYYIV